MNSPVGLGDSPATITPTGFYSQRFLRLSFPWLEPWLARSVLLRSCSSQFICMQIWDYPVLQPPPFCASSLPQLPIFAPSTSLNECFFFNSLVVGLSYSLIFWQFGLFFCLFLNLLLSFFLLCKDTKCIYLHIHLGWKLPHSVLFVGLL